MSASPWVDVLEFLTNRVPKLVEGVEGASKDSIAKLERLHGGPVPELYGQFLRECGASTGGFTLLNSVDFTLDAVLEFVPEVHPATYPPDRFLRIGIDTGESGTSEITDVYIDLKACSGLEVPLVGLDRYDEDDDPDPYEEGDEFRYGLDLWSRGVVSAARQGWADTCEFCQHYSVTAPARAKDEVFAELSRFSGQREMAPVMEPAPRALAVAKGATLWVIQRVDETRSRITVASDDVLAGRSDVAVLDDYFELTATRT